MIARAGCGALLGIDAHKVELEVDLTRQGIPAFTMVGLAEGAVRESKERVMAALKNSGYKLPPCRITVNLAPADMRKEGAGFDLPLALGVLAAAEIIPAQNLDGLFFAGELSLTGELKPAPGILPLAVTAKQSRARGMLVPFVNRVEASVVEGLSVFAPRSLSEAAAHVCGEKILDPVKPEISRIWEQRLVSEIDFDEVKGQEHAKRAIAIAAAGNHNILFTGPPGSGKSMLSKRVPTVLPPLRFSEALEVTKIYSVAGRLDPEKPLMATRPFRSPHHTISDAGLVGGGHHPKPGEISLAHRGVLFLDELPEFKKNVLEVLRQPLEDARVTISRAAVSLSYPADIMLVAAMNPCPCGFLTDPRNPCVCSPVQIQRYRSRISGPLLDRIDLHVDVPAVPYAELKSKKPGLSSLEMRQKISEARKLQAERYHGQPLKTNSELSGKWLEMHCPLGPQEHDFLERAVSSLGLSARAFTRILRIARTIADIDRIPQIGPAQLAEAVNYRALDRTRVF